MHCSLLVFDWFFHYMLMTFCYLQAGIKSILGIASNRKVYAISNKETYFRNDGPILVKMSHW